MDYETLFPGRFIKSADFKGKDVTLTILAIRAEDIEDKPKAIMTFENTKKAMVLNRTNAEALKLMFGRDTDGWIGHKVTFFPATIKDPFSDEMITAIRVRGSPELTKTASATIQRGRKTLKVSVAPTGKAKAAQKKEPAPPAGEPPEDLPLPGSAEYANGSDAPPLGDEDAPF